MNDLLPRDKVMDSFSAVGSFLQAGGYNPLQLNIFSCTVQIDRTSFYNDTFEFECRDYLDNETYILNSDSFKAKGYHQPVWSAYHLFSWDAETGQLTVTLNGKNYIIEHKQ